METIRKRDFVITGLQSWDTEIGSNCKNIAQEIAIDNRVLYVNPPVDRRTLWGKPHDESTMRHKALQRGDLAPLAQVSPNLWVFTPSIIIESINQLPINSLFDILNRHNNKLLAKEIRKAIAKLDFSDFIHFCDNDIFRSFYLKELLRPAAYIYYTRDNLLAVEYWQRQGSRIEPRHMAMADMVIANSSYLCQLASRHNPRSFFVGQGCDTTAFALPPQTPVPPDMSSIRGPIIGYAGVLKSLRLDIGLLVHIAKARPAWSLVLVGPEDDDFRASPLHSLPNVFFLGSKSPDNIPQYINAFDIAINPQVVNEVTRGNYPRKIDEYLAAGKPVVATFTEAMDLFSQHVSLASGPEQWVECIDHELRHDTPLEHSRRSQFASEHTWHNNVALIYHHISQHLNTHKP
jgi:glycosyltransferase involved in cell wall biosynthesis